MTARLIKECPFCVQISLYVFEDLVGLWIRGLCINECKDTHLNLNMYDILDVELETTLK